MERNRGYSGNAESKAGYLLMCERRCELLRKSLEQMRETLEQEIGPTSAPGIGLLAERLLKVQPEG